MIKATKIAQAMISMLIVGSFYLGFVPALMLEAHFKSTVPPIVADEFESLTVILDPSVFQDTESLDSEKANDINPQPSISSVSTAQSRKIPAKEKSKVKQPNEEIQPKTASRQQQRTELKAQANEQTEKQLVAKKQGGSIHRILAKAMQKRRSEADKKPSKKRVSKSSNKCKTKQKLFKKTGSNRYQLSKKTFMSYARDWVKASKLASLAWKINRSGEVIGVKVKGLRCQSPLQTSGVRRGDIITHIAGISVINNKQALKAYGRSLKYGVIQVRLLRRGKELRINYRLT